MLKESIIDKILYQVKKLIPKSVFNFFQPYYHSGLAYLGSALYGFPSRKLKVIGVTGTKGKSTVVYLITKLFEGNGAKVSACGSLGFKIGDKVFPNNLKMTMPGRFKLHKLMAEAVKAGSEYFILEVTSEGIKQKRHLGIDFDCAVFTNLHREHIEGHGSFENYYRAKQELFRVTKNIHVINADDKYANLFGDFSAQHKIYYGLSAGDIVAKNLKFSNNGSSFEVYGTTYNTHLAGQFNVFNFLTALAVGAMYGIDLPSAKYAIESIEYIPGRMEFIQRTPFNVVVDYAHTPDSLEQVYKTLKKDNYKLICVLGAAGGGRDKWKRPEFGRIASQYCDDIILTDEDPFEESPISIIDEIKKGLSSGKQYEIIINRKEAIKKALSSAFPGDTVVITGKGSENSMAVSGGKKIPWSDKEIVRALIDASLTK